jgi:hypothetical protein
VVSRPGRSRSSGTGTSAPPHRSAAIRLAARSLLVFRTVRVIRAGSPRATRSGSAVRDTSSRGRHNANPAAPPAATAAAAPSIARSG